ncbi:MAG TPA: sulfite exporter TauE/SafE family protein [Acidimicrobiales bacterium]|nr:sulfite exporter TauE/SafE family protein [Acidimicrobiales bacterium]
MNLYVVLGSAIVGLLVGMTGAGGGALMTPMLILLFNVKASTAISSDLVAAVAMRPFGAAVHAQRKTVNYSIVGWLAMGAAPAAFFGAWVLSQMSHAKAATANVEKALGAALLLGAAAMALRYILDRRSDNPRTGALDSVAIRPVPTLLAGVVGGIVVGLTSVGSGSLLIVMLMFIYPSLSAKRLVGTDLTQAIPLTAAAALGALAFGHVQLPLTAAIIAGSVPAVLLGSFLSSRTTDRFLRPVIFCVVLASGLKYAGFGTYDLAWGVGVAVTVILADHLWTRARRSRTVTKSETAERYRELSAAVANGQIAQ